MISTHLLRASRNALLKWSPRFAMNHIKDMREENVRVKMAGDPEHSPRREHQPSLQTHLHHRVHK